MNKILLFIMSILWATNLMSQGTSCSTAVSATADGNNIHDTGQYEYKWFSYTATQNGKIVLENLSDSPNSYVTVYTNCDSYSISGAYDELKFESTVGQTYYIRWNNYSSADFNWSLSEEALVTGDFCTYPKQATADDNNVHNFGEDLYQWFVYTATQDGKIVFENLATNGNSYVEVYTDCDSYLTYGNENFKFESTNGQTYYFRIQNYRSENFNWSLSEEAIEEGDFCVYPLQAISGSSNTCSFGDEGYQWFTYTATRDGKIVLENLEQYGSADVAVYSDCDTYLTSDYNKLSFSSITGQTYLIKWYNYYAQDFTWSLSEEDPNEGEFCKVAKTAALGDNTADNSEGNEWFTYTPTDNVLVTITTCDMTTEDTRVYIYGGCTDEYSMESITSSDDYCNTQSKVQFAAGANVTYYIKWTDDFTTSTYTWNISETALAEGEYCYSAFEAALGNNTADNSYGDVWYSYTPTVDGTMTISTCGLTSEDTKLYIYNDCNSYYLDSSDDYCSSQSELSLEVVANTTYYIKWDDAYTQTSFTWNLSLEADEVSTSINDVENSGFNLYPNPASTQITIDSEKPLQYLRIVNTQGSVVKDVESPSDVMEINLPKGLYIVVGYFEDGRIANQKLLVE